MKDTWQSSFKFYIMKKLMADAFSIWYGLAVKEQFYTYICFYILNTTSDVCATGTKKLIPFFSFFLIKSSDFDVI